MQSIDRYLQGTEQHKIFTPNPEICLKAEKNASYREILNQSSINIPDGFGLKLGAKILQEKLEHRITGVDLTKAILDTYKESNLNVFIVLREDSLCKEADIKQLFKKQYPKVKLTIGLVNIKDPFECDEVLNKINDITPQIVFIALGAPAQELWIHKYLKIIPSVKLALGIGGTFDFLTGKMPRAPKVVRQLGMEWFYRLYKEPNRLKRIKNATADFLLKCHIWKKRINSEYRTNVVGVLRNKQGKFLIQKNARMKNHWQFPQGGVDKGEEPDQAAMREVSEEIGTDPQLLKLIKLIPESHTYDWPPYGQLLKGYKGQTQTAYLIEFLGQKSDIDPSNSHEVDEVKWVSKSELLEQVHPARKTYIKKLLKHI